MKIVSVFICMLLAMSLNVKAQQTIEDVRKVNYYGIDFSEVEILGADESVEQFKTAFNAINELTIRERQKYDFGKFFKKLVDVQSFEVVDKRNTESIPSMLSYSVSSKEIQNIHLAPAEVKEVIANYGNSDEGIGVVIIAVLLNKYTAEATYDVVFFDVKTKDIVFEKQVVGKARGFGLRNYWAHSVISAVKGFKYK